MTETTAPADLSDAGRTSSVNEKNPTASVVLNVLATFIISISMGMCSIIFPLTLQSNGVGTSMIGVVMSLETLSSLVMCFFLPAILKFLGMKAGMILSTIIRVPPLVLLAFTNDFNIWLAAVFMIGVGCFSFLILLQTWINSIPFKRNKGLMVALYSTAISIGLACGPIVIRYADEIQPVIMPVFHTVLGWIDVAAHTDDEALGKQFKFLLAALLSLLALVPVALGFFLVPSFKFRGKARILHTIMQAKGPMFAVAMGGVSIFGVSAFITLYGIKNDLSIADSALLLSSFMLGSLFLEAPLTWVSDFLDRRYVIVAASFLSMVCAVYLPIAIYDPYEAWTLLFIWGGLIGAIYSTALALIGDRFEDEALVSANAGYSMMDAAGGTAGILLIGLLMDAFGSDGLPYVIMFASIVYFSFALTRYRVV